MLIFDLDEKNIKFKNKLQSNIRLLYYKFGNKFMIKDGNIIVPVSLEIIKTNNTKYYSLYYDIEYRDNYLLPFKIDFIDTCSYKLNNNCYIANITKYQNISGSVMVNFVLKILKILKAKIATLYDDTSIRCGDGKIGLSYFKLIEKQESFYQRFGFKYMLKCNPKEDFFNKFTSDKGINRFLQNIIESIKKIKLSELLDFYKLIISILIEVNENKNFDDLMLIKEYIKGYIIYEKEITKKKIKSFIKDIQKFIDNLLEANKSYDTMFDLMINIFKNNCELYTFFIDSMVNHYLIGIRYKNKNYITNYKQPFFDLYAIKDLRLYINIRDL